MPQDIRLMQVLTLQVNGTGGPIQDNLAEVGCAGPLEGTLLAGGGGGTGGGGGDRQPPGGGGGGGPGHDRQDLGLGHGAGRRGGGAAALHGAARPQEVALLHQSSGRSEPTHFFSEVRCTCSLYFTAPGPLPPV